MNLRNIGEIQGMVKMLKQCGILFSLLLYAYYAVGHSPEDIVDKLKAELEEAKAAFLESEDTSQLTQVTQSCAAYLTLTADVNIYNVN